MNRMKGRKRVTGMMRISPRPSSSNTASSKSGSTRSLTRSVPWRNPVKAQKVPQSRPVSQGLSSPKRPATCRDTKRTHLAMSRRNLSTPRTNPFVFSTRRNRSAGAPLPSAEARVDGASGPSGPSGSPDLADSAVAGAGRLRFRFRPAPNDREGVTRSRPNSHPNVILPEKSSRRTTEKVIVTGIASSTSTESRTATGMSR